MQLSRTIHANEEGHKELGIRLLPAPSCIIHHRHRVDKGIAGHYEASVVELMFFNKFMIHFNLF